MEVKYYAKYLKYKNKYIQLKKQMGGCAICQHDECINGELCGAGKKMTVVNWGGDELCEITVLPADNTNKLYEAIHESQGVHINDQRLALENGTPIEPGHRFADYGITEDSTITLTIMEDTSTKFYFTDAPETPVIGKLSELRTIFADRRKQLKRVIVGSDITTLGNKTFDGCSALVSVEMPSVTSIGNSTFYMCWSLKNVVLSENLTTLGNGTFAFCRALEQVVIPSSVTLMGDLTFFNCESLRHIRLSEQLTGFGNSTFSSCNALERIDIPASVTSIGEDVFAYCGRLNTVVIHGNGKILFARHQILPSNIRFYTNNPSVTTFLTDHLRDQYLPDHVFRKEEAPPAPAIQDES